MKKALFLSAFVLCAAPAAAAETGQCDATAFTLGKPATAMPKAAKPKPVAKQAAVQPVPKKPRTTTSRLLSSCKDGKKKKSG